MQKNRFTIMQTAGVVLFVVDLLKAMHTGYKNVDREYAALEEPKQQNEIHHTGNWKPIVGLGMMVIVGAFLILGMKKSSST